MKKVFIVGYMAAEEFSIKGVHSDYSGALKAWNKLRLELINEAKKSLEKPNRYMSKKINSDAIQNLSCEDPDKIDNYPFETPFIQRWEVINDES